MAWLGLRHGNSWRFDPEGHGRESAEWEDMPVPSGTLMMEFRRLTTDSGRRNVLRYSVRDPWPSALILRSEPEGGLRLLHRQGTRSQEYHLAAPAPQGEERYRLTYHWDAPARTARLTLHGLEGDVLCSQAYQRPFPLFRSDIAAILEGRGGKSHIVPDYVAFADHQVPIGPLGGLAEDVELSTPGGLVRAGELRAGDAVLAADGRLAQVLHVAGAEVPALGHLAPVRVRAPGHELEQDVILSGGWPLVLRGALVDFLFGKETVTARIEDLADGHAVTVEEGAPFRRYVQIILDRPVGPALGKLSVAAPELTALAERPELAGLTLFESVPPAAWPSGGSTPPCLRPFEALSYRRGKAA